MEYSYLEFESIQKKIFSKGYIIDDYEYNEKMRSTGGSIVYYSQELYTESLDSQKKYYEKVFR